MKLALVKEVVGVLTKDSLNEIVGGNNGTDTCDGQGDTDTCGCEGPSLDANCIITANSCLCGDTDTCDCGNGGDDGDTCIGDSSK